MSGLSFGPTLVSKLERPKIASQLTMIGLFTGSFSIGILGSVLSISDRLTVLCAVEYMPSLLASTCSLTSDTTTSSISVKRILVWRSILDMFISIEPPLLRCVQVEYTSEKAM